MFKSSKTLLMLLCLCVFAFKVVATQRFIENGIKRAQIYATFHDPFLGDQASAVVKVVGGKGAPVSFPTPVLLSAILIAICLWISWGRLRSYLRPIVIKLLLFWFFQKIFRPPRVVYLAH